MAMAASTVNFVGAGRLGETIAKLLSRQAKNTSTLTLIRIHLFLRQTAFYLECITPLSKAHKKLWTG